MRVGYGNRHLVCFLAVSISGVIINTGGWIKGGGYDSLKHAAGSFEGGISQTPHPFLTYLRFLILNKYNTVISQE